jgi:hypothetical protein
MQDETRKFLQSRPTKDRGVKEDKAMCSHMVTGHMPRDSDYTDRPSRDLAAQTWPRVLQHAALRTTSLCIDDSFDLICIHAINRSTPVKNNLGLSFIVAEQTRRRVESYLFVMRSSRGGQLCDSCRSGAHH